MHICIVDSLTLIAPILQTPRSFHWKCVRTYFKHSGNTFNIFTPSSYRKREKERQRNRPPHAVDLTVCIRYRKRTYFQFNRMVRPTHAIKLINLTRYWNPFDGSIHQALLSIRKSFVTPFFGCDIHSYMDHVTFHKTILLFISNAYIHRNNNKKQTNTHSTTKKHDKLKINKII